MILTLLACGVARTADPPAPQVTASSPAPDEQVRPAQAPPAQSPVEPLPTEGPFTRELAPGLVLAAYAPPEIADPGYSAPDPASVSRTDRRLFVVTIDPARYELRYLSARDESLEGVESMSADGWAERFDLQVVWNPGMFEPDGKATGYTRSGSFTSQPGVRRNGLYRGWFLADPLGEGPLAATLDELSPKGEGSYAAMSELPGSFRARIEGYSVVSQSLAVLRDGRAVYPPRKNQWSELAYGTDRAGNVVVVFSRYPYEMREFGARVAALELGIDGLIHGEGGPEASLVVRAGSVSLSLCGSYETGFADDSNEVMWSLPAVMGVQSRSKWVGSDSDLVGLVKNRRGSRR